MERIYHKGLYDKFSVIHQLVTTRFCRSEKFTGHTFDIIRRQPSLIMKAMITKDNNE